MNNDNKKTFDETEESKAYTDDADTDKQQIDERNNTYTELLKIYSNYIKNVLKENADNKKTVTKFLFALGIILVIGFIVIILAVIFCNPEKLISISAIVSALVSVIATIIVIPTKVIEYLFNPNEMQQIGEIIKNIQEYDKNVRDDIREFRKKDTE